MLKQIILRNYTASDIELAELGEIIPANDEINLSSYSADELRNVSPLMDGILTGNIIVFDGTIELDSQIGKEYVSNDTISDEDGFWYGKRRRFSILWQQTGHSFIQGQVLKLDESTGLAALALADTHANSATTAVVSELVDANSFYAGLTGSVVKNIDAGAVEGGLPMTPGTAYFLSSTVPGQITTTIPSGAGEIVKLVGLAVDVNAIMVFSYSGYANETAIDTGPDAAQRILDASVSGNVIRRPNTWMYAIDKETTDPSVGIFSNGDRFIIGTGAIGVWAGKDTQVAEYIASTSSWYYTSPEVGAVVYNRGDNIIQVFDGAAWSILGGPQNLFETITADIGSVTALTATSTLNIAGGNRIGTSISGNTLTIDFGNFSLTDLSDVDTTGETQDSFLKYNASSTNWEVTALSAASPLPNVQGRSTAALNNVPLSWVDYNFDITDIENDVAVIDHDDVNRDRFIVKEDGLYMVTYYFTVENEAQARVRLNDNTVIPGSEVEGGDINDGGGFSESTEVDQLIEHTFFVDLTANDFMTLQVQSRTSFENIFIGALFTVTKMQGAKGADGAQGPAGTGTTVNVQEEGVAIPNTPHNTFNFVGTGVTATDAGAGITDITIPGFVPPTPQLFYGHNGGIVQTLTSSFSTVNISTNVRIDAIYSISSNEVTVNENGWYKITYSVGAEATSSTRSGMECQLELNGSLVPGSMAWAYHRTTSPGEDTATAEVLLQITSGDEIRVRMRERNGSIQTMANGCRLLIDQIEKI